MVMLVYHPQFYEEEDEPYMFPVPALEFHLVLLRKNLEEVRPRVFSIELMEYRVGCGFLLTGRYGRMKITSHEWSDTSSVVPTDPELFGVDAARALRQYRSRSFDAAAREVAEELRKETTTFEDLRDYLPAVFDHPLIQRMLAHAFRDDRMPKRRKGKRPTLTKQLFELYNWVCYYRNTEANSLSDACARAIDNHPTLVPQDWTDELETLKKNVRKFERSWPYDFPIDYPLPNE